MVLDKTIDYYNQNAEQYIARTSWINMEPARTRFLSYLPSEALILDAGCGSGRDALAFQSLGHRVLAIDASEEMVRSVTAQGIPAQQMYFEDLSFSSQFDGIWCSASLLHVQKEILPQVMDSIYKALKPNGICFVSYKYGQGEALENGRYFHFMDEKTLDESCRAFEILEVWHYSSDVNLVPTIWLNALLRKPFS